MPADELGPLAAALAKAQPDFKPVKRDKKVTVQTKTGGSYSFQYAPLEAVLAAVQPALAKNGLAVVQLLDEGHLVTALVHDSGAIMSGRIALPTGVDAQGLGSAITYLRRYAIQALLGIAAEDDDDGNRAVGNTATDAAAAPARPNTGRAGGGEAEAFLGLLTKAGTIRKGGGAGYKLERREGPEGAVFGFRLELPDKAAGDTEDNRDIPQVLVPPKVAVPLLADLGGDPGVLDGTQVTVKGQLYNVKAPGRTAYYRLIVTEWHDAERVIAPDKS